MDSSAPTAPDSPRDRILDAASAEFAERGFSGTRVDEIARRAGVNKAMLYYHVGNKEKLYTAVLMRNFDRVSAVLEGARSQNGSVPHRLRVLVDGLVRAVTANPDHPRIVMREVASGGATLPPEVLARMLQVVDVVRELLQEGMQRGEFRSVNPILTHLMLVGSVVFMTSVRPLQERAMALSPESGFPGPDTDLAAFISDLILQGLEARPITGGAQ
jgi:TetR/AcrR family transcriptional regulator